jgi:hypothetical protein
LRMTKTVICSNCRRAFRVEGSAGVVREVAVDVTWPYIGCGAPNEVHWSPDASHKAIAIYNLPSSLTQK